MSLKLSTRDEVDALMKRCQIGVGGRNALYDAHDIMAECYGTLGRQKFEIERLNQSLRAYRCLKMAVDAMIAQLSCHGTISARDDRVSEVMDCLYQIDGLNK